MSSGWTKSGKKPTAEATKRPRTVEEDEEDDFLPVTLVLRKTSAKVETRTEAMRRRRTTEEDDEGTKEDSKGEDSKKRTV